MDDLIAFVKARLDEDEAMAAAVVEEIERYPDASELNARWNLVPTYTPARVLREVEAKHRIVSDYETSNRACRDVTGADLDGRGYAAMAAGRDALRAACVALAAAWSDRPEYQQEWALGLDEPTQLRSAT